MQRVTKRATVTCSSGLTTISGYIYGDFRNSIAGKMSFTWFGPIPRVMIPDPELVKEVLSNKFGHFGKPRSSRIGKLLADGVVNHDGEKWAKHRRILNPAFHHEKIKVWLSLFFLISNYSLLYIGYQCKKDLCR